MILIFSLSDIFHHYFCVSTTSPLYVIEYQKEWHKTRVLCDIKNNPWLDLCAFCFANFILLPDITIIINVINTWWSISDCRRPATPSELLLKTSYSAFLSFSDILITVFFYWYINIIAVPFSSTLFIGTRSGSQGVTNWRRCWKLHEMANAEVSPFFKCTVSIWALGWSEKHKSWKMQ